MKIELKSPIATRPNAVHCDRAALLARIERKFPVTSELLEVGALKFTLFRVAEPDILLDRIPETPQGDQPRWQPYWAQVWESAKGLALLLGQRRLDRLRVLDLGCGLGLPGMTAAARGAQVLMADAVPAALLFARLNGWPWRERIRVRCLDWLRDRLAASRAGPPFDLIVGADILYDRTDWPLLDRFWRQHLAEGGEVLLGEPGRGSGLEFAEWIVHRGWRMESSELAVEGLSRPMRIFSLHRCEGKLCG